jgi:hypothetical protein
MIPTKCIFIPVPFHQQFTFLAASRISTIFLPDQFTVDPNPSIP